MTIKELNEKRHKLIVDAQAILLSDNVTAESRAQAHKMIADSDAIENDINQLEALETRSKQGNPIPRGEVSRGNESADERNHKAKEALLTYFRGGAQALTAEHRSYLPEVRTGLTTATTAEVIPQAFYPTLIDAKKSYGQILNILGSKKSANGAPMKIALTNDTGNMVTVIGENTAVTETDPAFSGVICSTDELTTGSILISFAELQDSAFDLNSWFKNQFGQRYFRGLTNLVTNGSESGNFVALTSITAGVTSASGVAVSYDDLTALYGSVDPAYIETSSWSMNSTTRAYLMGIKDTLGRPLFIDNPQSGAFSVLLGRPVVLNQSLPNIGVNNKAIQLGDFKQGYLLREAGDLSVLRLTERYAELGMVGFIGYGRAGGVVTDGGTHPIVTLTQAAE